MCIALKRLHAKELDGLRRGLEGVIHEREMHVEQYGTALQEQSAQQEHTIQALHSQV